MEFRINYNPYKLKTEFFLDGEALPEDNRFSAIKEKRLQQWLVKNGDWKGLYNELYDLTNGGRIEIKFRGRLVEYEDLKLYLEQENTDRITLCEPELTKNDQDITIKLDEIVKKVVLKYTDVFTEEQISSIFNSYKKARDSKFKVCVIATMSSGKSTLINALLGKDLLPTKSGACTATETTIMDNDNMDSFHVKCFDVNDNEVKKSENVTLEKLEAFNDDENIRKINLIGPVPGIESKKMSLYLVDTPGPNNSTNDDHEKLTNDIIQSDENTVVIYVMNPTTIQQNDNDKLLQSIAKVMQNEGKQAEDRFLFVINRCDDLEPESKDDTVEHMLKTAKEYLKEKNILYPNIYPVTAKYAKLIRMNENKEDLSKKEVKEMTGWIENFKSNDPEDLEYQRLCSFEQFASLSPESRENIRKRLDAARAKENIREEALIHTGVPALEEMIEEYLEKYAYPMKINDSIKTLIDTIDQEEMKGQFNQAIQEDKEVLIKVKKDIEESCGKLKGLENKKRNMLEKIKLFKFEINQESIKRDVSRDLAKMTKDYSGQEEIKKEVSKRIFEEFNKKQQSYISTLERALANQIETEIVEKGQGMLQEFRLFMGELKASINIQHFDFNKVVSFKNCDIKNLDNLIEEHTEEKSHEEVVFIKNPKKNGFLRALKFWEPGEIMSTKCVSDGEFVNVYKVVEETVMGWKSDLYTQIQDAFKRAQCQVEQFNLVFERNINQTEKIVNDNLKEINDNIEKNLNMKKEEKEKSIKANNEKIKIITGIHQELTEILDF